MYCLGPATALTAGTVTLRAKLEGGESAADISTALDRSADDVLTMMSRLSLRVRT